MPVQTSKVGFWTHFWASLAGYVLPLLLVSLYGQALFDALKDAPVGVWIGLGGALAGISLASWMRRRRVARAG